MVSKRCKARAVSARPSNWSRYVEEGRRCWIFGELASVRVFYRGVSVKLVTRRLGIGAVILVLLPVLRAGVAIAALNGKSQVS